MKNTSSKLIMLALAAALAACGGDNTAKPAASSDAAPQQEQAAQNGLQTKFVTVGTGGASGPYNIIGTALSELYAQKFGVNAKTQTTGASVENLNLLAQNKLEMAFVMSDALSDAINGQGSFSRKVETWSKSPRCTRTMCKSSLPPLPASNRLKTCAANGWPWVHKVPALSWLPVPC